MQVSVTDAKARLLDLVRRAGEGEEVVLTRHGQPVVRLAPVQAPANAQTRARLIAEVREAARMRRTPGPDAARSQDFLYDDNGLPQSP
jgi:prevent-host-death family protein